MIDLGNTHSAQMAVSVRKESCCGANGNDIECCLHQDCDKREVFCCRTTINKLTYGIVLDKHRHFTIVGWKQSLVLTSWTEGAGRIASMDVVSRL